MTDPTLIPATIILFRLSPSPPRKGSCVADDDGNLVVEKGSWRRAGMDVTISGGG